MKIKEGFILKNIAGENIVVPVGEKVIDFTAMISLNETSATIWKLMENDVEKEEIVAALLEEYDVAEEKVKADVDVFVDKLVEAGLVE